MYQYGGVGGGEESGGNEGGPMFPPPVRPSSQQRAYAGVFVLVSCVFVCVRALRFSYFVVDVWLQRVRVRALARQDLVVEHPVVTVLPLSKPTLHCPPRWPWWKSCR